MKHTQKGNKHFIEYDCKCDSCKGTGIYVGFAERGGAGVVCNNCDGTGKIHVKDEYEEFDEKAKRKGISRVFMINPGIGIGKGPVVIDGKDVELTLEEFGGMSYEDWFAGKRWPKGHEMRKYTCPAWYYQSADYEKKPDWKSCIACGSFSSCEHYGNRAKCWDRWDKEYNK